VAECEFFLGVDGGGTRCRARLCGRAGIALGEGEAGPANLRLGIAVSLAAVLVAARQCLTAAGLAEAALARTAACLSLAGASEPAELAAARRQMLPFGRTLFVTDAYAACIGAHQGADGGVVIAGTGSIGWTVVAGRQYRVGGWGLPLSDEGSGAWLGREALRVVLQAHDGRTRWTGLLHRLSDDFNRDPHGIVRWAAGATPADFGALAPLVVDHASRGDDAAIGLMQSAAAHIEALAARLVELGADRLALVGGLAAAVAPWLGDDARRHFVAPLGDGLAGALLLARADAAAEPAREAAL